MKRKILIFTPGSVGGAERMCITIGQMLPEDRFDVEYVILGRENHVNNLIPKEAKVDRIPFRKIYHFVTLRIWWKIIHTKPDIVFSSLALTNPMVIIAAKMAKTKTIIRSSGMVGDYHKIKFLFLKFTYPLADVLIAQQEDMRQEMIKMMNIPSHKIITLLNPIDSINIEKYKDSLSPFNTNNEIRFVNTARLHPYKGQDIAIRAMRKVRTQIPNAHIYFVGAFNKNDAYFKSLTDIVEEQGLKDCVHFVGFDKNPFRWIKYCDCFVFPSRKEGLPNSLIEASYIGVPCAATTCLNVVNDIIENGYNGYTADVDDVDGLALAMIKALDLDGFKMKYCPSTPDEFIHLFESI
jgi:glycosyltransferase involved in cell wall biosynthesis